MEEMEDIGIEEMEDMEMEVMADMKEMKAHLISQSTNSGKEGWAQSSGRVVIWCCMGARYHPILFPTKIPYHTIQTIPYHGTPAASTCTSPT